MAQPNTEPSMDEILASIRRIIAEDDQPSLEKQAQLETLQLAEEDAVEGADRSMAEAKESTEALEADGPAAAAEEELPAEATAEVVSDPLDDYDHPEPPAPSPSAQEESVSMTAAAAPALQDQLVGAEASEAAADAFGALEENVRLTNQGARTIEDLVETMLQPMVRQWLDTHLPRIVEEKVEEEVRRIARRR